MKLVPLYAPLKIQDMNLDLLAREAEALQLLASEDLITHNNGISVHDIEGRLTRHLCIQPNTYQTQDADGNVKVSDKASFKSLNLTYLPEHSDSLQRQFYVDSNNRKKAFLFEKVGKWAWRKDVNTDVFQQFISTLNLKEVHLVRLIYLIPPAVGGVHIDVVEKSMEDYYRDRQGVSLTFNLKSGNSTLSFISENKIYEVPSKLKAWHFNPSTPHAVGEIRELRVQLRIFGSLDSQDYLNLLDLNQSIW
jgi:hypothetical protein